MPRPRGHVYNLSEMRALEGIRIPEKLKCDRCNKYKNAASFSNRQLTDVRYAVKSQGQAAARYKIKCQVCVGGQPVEIECSVCGVTKGLEEFAKSQRKKIDRAECYKCTAKRLDVDPVKEETYDNADRSRAFVREHEYVPSIWDLSEPSSTASEWSEAASNSDDRGGVGLSEGFARKMSFADASTADTLIQTEYDRSEAGGQGSWRTPSQPSSTSRGFNPNRYGNPAANRSVSVSQRSFNSGFAEPSDTMSRNGNFAKIKAYDPKKDPDAKPVDQWSSDEENSDSGESDDDDDSDEDVSI